MGLIWSFVNPLLLLAVYTVVFSYIIKGASFGDEKVGIGTYALYLFAGLVPYNLFSEVLSRAPAQITANPNYVKRVVFPLEILTVINTGAAIVNGALGIGVLLITELALRQQLPWTVVFYPLVIAPLVLIGLGLSWFLGSLGTYVRDISQFIGVLLQGLLFLSAVFWPINKAPELVRPYLVLNPIAVVAEASRDALVSGKVPDVVSLLVWVGIGCLAAWGGYVWFMFTKRGFADVI